MIYIVSAFLLMYIYQICKGKIMSTLLKEKPLYKQLSDIIKNDILEGKWELNTILPSEKEIAKIYSVSQGTVKKTMQKLVNEGLLSRRRGYGTYINKLTTEKSFFKYWCFGMNDNPDFDAHNDLTTELVKIEMDFPKNKKELKLTNNKKVILVHIHRNRIYKGKPVVYEEIILIKNKFNGIEKAQIPHGIYPFLQLKFNTSVKSTHDVVTVEKNENDISKILKCDKDTPMLKCERYTKNLNDEIFEYRISFANPSIMNYSISKD